MSFTTLPGRQEAGQEVGPYGKQNARYEARQKIWTGS